MVSVYDKNGWTKDLQPLNIGRAKHGCTSFLSGNQRVKKSKFTFWEGKNLKLIFSSSWSLGDGAKLTPLRFSGMINGL